MIYVLTAKYCSLVILVFMKQNDFCINILSKHIKYQLIGYFYPWLSFSNNLTRYNGSKNLADYLHHPISLLITHQRRHMQIRQIFYGGGVASQFGIN